MFMNTITDRIEHIRVQNGLSYQGLADLVGNIKGDAIRKAIVRGKIKDHYVNIISEKLGVNKEWILSGKGDIKNKNSFEASVLKSEISTDENGISIISIGNMKIPIKDLAGILEENYQNLLLDSSFKLFMNDKINNGMFKFFKEHGIEVKIKGK